LTEVLTLVAPSESKSRDSSDYSKDIVRKRGDDLALGRVRPVQSKTGSRSSDDLLLFCSCELSKDSLGDSSRRLNSQAVHKHSRSGRHLAALVGTQKACATGWRELLDNDNDSDSDSDSFPVVEG